MKKLSLLSLLLVGILALHAGNDIKEQFWPKEIEAKGGVVTLYQPQLESFKDDILEGRMAFSVKKADQEPLFGALWFTTRLETNIDERTVVFKEIDIIKVHFPGIDDQEKIDKFTNFLIREVESWDMVMSMDRLASSLSDVEDLNRLSVSINNEPPDIYFRTEPAVLISIDGDPILKKIEGSDYEYVVNTAFFVVKSGNTYYVKGGKFWYESANILSGYSEASKVPSGLVRLAEQNMTEQETDSISESLTKAPELILVTKPSELITTNGKPDYATIKGTSLLYVDNTSSDVVMDINSQKHFVLLAGRWYSSSSLEDGDWTFIEPSDLPDDFSKIPEESDISDVRASVPGTPEAQDALLEQTIPQTATVDRKTTTVKVQWDGSPKFEKIKNTEVSVAKNSDKTVLLIGNKYYCVDDAIWFVSNKPEGPWEVSDTRPEEVDQIPPESEAYNVKYVYIYESTPEVVYVGYLPGYNWSFVYGGCVVYGTGYWYRPWYHHYYYPRPVTWGFGVHWNPYTGWGFSFGFSYGWVGWGFHPYGSWWGPRGFYPGYRHGYYRGYHHGYRHGAARGYAAGYNAARRNTHNNVYHNRSAGVKTAERTRPANRNKNLNTKARPSNRPNNVYTDRSGNVYKRSNKGNWENVTNGNRAKPQTKPSGNQPTTRPSGQTQTKPKSRPNTSISSQQKQQLNRQYQNRSRGAQNYNRARSYSGGGAARGGGRRR